MGAAWVEVAFSEIDADAARMSAAVIVFDKLDPQQEFSRYLIRQRFKNQTPATQASGNRGENNLVTDNLVTGATIPHRARGQTDAICQSTIWRLIDNSMKKQQQDAGNAPDRFRKGEFCIGSTGVKRVRPWTLTLRQNFTTQRRRRRISSGNHSIRMNASTGRFAIRTGRPVLRLAAPMACMSLPAAGMRPASS